MADVKVLGIDPAAIGGWLPQLVIAFSGPLSFERIGLGQSNLTYRVRDADGREWVLRRPPLGSLLASVHDVAREAKILSALGDAAAPAPRMYGLTRDPDDLQLLLMGFVDGLVVDRMSVAESLTPQRRGGRPRRLGQSQAVRAATAQTAGRAVGAVEDAGTA